MRVTWCVLARKITQDPNLVRHRCGNLQAASVGLELLLRPVVGACQNCLRQLVYGCDLPLHVTQSCLLNIMEEIVAWPCMTA